jgi:hypothetical protein
MPQVIISLDCPRKVQRIHAAEGIAFLLTMSRLYGWQMNPARGCYKGQLENSFIIDGHALVLGSDQLGVLQDLLAACGQESMVWISSRGHAQLIYNDGSERAEAIGVWTELPDKADRPDSWTEDDEGRVFVCSGA